MRGVCEKQWLICVYLSDSCFIYCISTLATRITLRFRRGFCRGFRQGFLSVMLGCETEGGSSSSSGASSSRRSRTLVVLDVGCLEPFIVKGEPHRLKLAVEEVEKSIQSVCYRERRFEQETEKSC